MGRKSSGEGKHTKNSVRLAREKAGMTQVELSNATGISTSVLSRTELSRRKSSLDILEKVAKALNVTTSSLADVPLESNPTTRVIVNESAECNEWFLGDTVWPPEDRYEVTAMEVGLFPDIPRSACEVRGNSMDRVYPDGTVIVHVDHMKTGEPFMPGRRYTLKRTNVAGEVELSVRTYARDSEGGDIFYCESNDPKYAEPFRFGGAQAAYSLEVKGRVIGSWRPE